jgi:hypothetical protein
MNDLLSAMENSVLDMKRCLNCKVQLKKITSVQNKLMTTVYKSDETSE